MPPSRSLPSSSRPVSRSASTTSAPATPHWPTSNASRSFVTGLAGDDDHASEALITSIISLGRAFGLRVVAEGVEDAQTLERLAALGCDTAQGYYFGRPRPAEELPGTARALLHAGGVPVPRHGHLRPVAADTAST